MTMVISLRHNLFSPHNLFKSPQVQTFMKLEVKGRTDRIRDGGYQEARAKGAHTKPGIKDSSLRSVLETNHLTLCKTVE